MSIKVGDKLPEADFKILTSDGLGQVSTGEYFGGQKVALFAVPGAFTPTCHAQHVPGFLNNLDALKAKGVDKVACVAVNDAFVLDAATLLAAFSGAGSRRAALCVHAHASTSASAFA